VVNALRAADEEGAGFIGVAAEGNDMVEILTLELCQGFGTMMGNVDAQFEQHPGGQRINPRGFGSGGKGFAVVSQIVVGQSFGHLGAAGIVGAEKEDAPHKNPLLGKLLLHIINATVYIVVKLYLSRRIYSSGNNKVSCQLFAQQDVLF